MMATLFWIITNCENAPLELHKDFGYHPWNGFSFFFHVVLPVSCLIAVFGRRGIFSKILLQFDRNCVAVCCPSLSKREKLLKWASTRLPPTWSSQAKTLSNGIPELWKDGSLLCVLINSVVPGACPNPHRHWKKAPVHAQTLAFKYLGVIPVFTQNELLSDFTINEEKRFLHYLYKLQEAVIKWPTDCESRRFSSEYVARGMGLYTGEQHKKSTFYIYSSLPANKQKSVTLYIKGPYGTEGKASISTLHNLKVLPVAEILEDQIKATKTLPVENENSFLKKISLKFVSLFSNDENKVESGKIPIQVHIETSRAKVSYIPSSTGIYEIHLYADYQLLKGSPYRVNVIRNTSGARDSFNESENVKEKVFVTKRKVLSKVIDCIDDKIYITENEELQDERADDVTITAISKRKNEILKTEINCTLENIMEEGSLDCKSSVDCLEKNRIEDLSKMAQDLNSELLQEKTAIAINPQHKLVKNCDEAREEILKILHKNPEFEKKNFERQNETLKGVKSEICLEISAKSTPKPKPTIYRSVTSPICPAHIAPEVDLNPLKQLSLAEKRKVFAKQESFECTPTEKKDSKAKVLSVLDVLDTIKTASNCETDRPLSSSKSLPDIASDELDNESNRSFRERKEYWERLSSVSSSNDSMSTFEYVRRNSQGEAYSSKDSSLEDCSVIPLQERRKQLLKKFGTTFYLPIGVDLASGKETKKKFTTSSLKQSTKGKHEKNNNSVTSQFKRAINYFRNLEDISKDNLSERHSFRRKSLNEEGKDLELPDCIKSFFY